MKRIITSRTLKLGDNFAAIKEKIETYPKYASLKKRKLCEFNPENNELVYRTEKIYPNRSEHPQRIPVLLLFSNPHPDSVARGLFLSEPHSRSFWQRLFESDYLCLPVGGINLERWDESTLKLLGKLMLEGKYESRFLLYFHCLFPIPTRQLADLKRLFKSAPHLWAKIERSGMEELGKLTKDERIKHIVVFAGPTFQALTGASVETYKGWRNKVKHSVDDYLKDRDTGKYWASLCAGYAKTKLGSNDVDIYLGLDTWAKNMGKGMGKRYFTWALDMILAKINSPYPSDSLYPLDH